MEQKALYWMPEIGYKRLETRTGKHPKYIR